MMRWSVSLLLIVFSVAGFSQKKEKEKGGGGGFVIDDDYFRKQKEKRDGSQQFEEKLNWGDAIYAYVSSQYRPFGIHFDPGVTYMIGNSADDKGQSYNLQASGLPGYYLGFGMQHLVKKVHIEQDPASPFYFDWDLGLKHFGGVEKYEEGATKSRSVFNFGNVFAKASFHGVIQINPWTFVDQGLGMNFDYRIYGGKNTTNPPLGGSSEFRPVFGLNYTLGWGIKLREGLFVIPTIQMPIMKFVRWGGFNPSHIWFNSRYEPAIFTIKFGWLFPKRGCPPVFDNNGEGKEQNERYEMR
jgi:hypothetical protein